MDNPDGWAERVGRRLGSSYATKVLPAFRSGLRICASAGIVLAAVIILASVLISDGGIAAASVGTSSGVSGTTTLNAISCVSSTTCWAVGTNGKAGVVVPIINGVAGSVTTVPDYAVTDLMGISCPSSTTCWVVGSGGTSYPSATIPISITDGTPSIGEAIAIAVNDLYGISCYDLTTCMAVGVLNGGGIAVPITNGKLGSRDGILPAAAELYGVSCVSSSTCLAVGFNNNTCTTCGDEGVVVSIPSDGNSYTGQAYVSSTTSLQGISCQSSTCETVGTNGSEGVALSVSTSLGLGTVMPVSGSTGLDGVSCISSSTCKAAGVNGSSGGVVVSVTNETPGNAIGASGSTSLYGISCGNAAICQAVGTNGSEGVVVPVTDTGPGPATVSGAYALSGVSCNSPSSCWAVGYADGGPGEVQPFTLSSGTITLGSLSSVSGTSSLTGISCVSGGSCFAVGKSGSGEGVFVGPICASGCSSPVVYDVPGSKMLSSVACPSSTACYAVGESSSSEGIVLAMALASSGPTTSTVGGTQAFTAIACPTTSECVAVGYNSNFYSVVVPIISGSPGNVTTLQGSPPNNFIDGVSCLSDTTCYGVGSNNGSTEGTVTPLTLSSNSVSVGTVELAPGSTLLNAVACSTPSTCDTVGGSVVVPMNAGIPSSAVTAAGSTGLRAIDCPSNIACVAAGVYITSSSLEGVLVPITVEPTTTKLTPSTTSPVVGETVSYLATILPEPVGGIVDFTQDGTPISGCASAAVNPETGTATCTVSYSSVASYNILATFQGWGSGAYAFAPSRSYTIDVTVRAASTQTTITSTTSNPVVGEPITVHVTVAPKSPGAGAPTGTVKVTDGTQSCNASLTKGTNASTGSCSITETAKGSYSFSASYTTNTSNYNDSSTSSSTPVTVGATSTTTTITSTTSNPVVGQPITVDVEVAPVSPGAGAPPGTVKVTDGTQSCNASLTKGTNASTGSCSITETAKGSYSFTATYTATTNYDSSTSSSTSVSVKPASTTTTITSTSPSNPVVGEPITVDVEVAPVSPGAGAPPGTASISDGAGQSCTATLTQASNSSTGSCKITETSAGTYSFGATYNDSATDFDSSTSQVTSVTVVLPPLPAQAPVVPVVSAISPSSGPPSGGTSVVVTGIHLLNAAVVDFGATSAQSFQVISSTEIEATAPPGSAGETVNITVITPGGTSASTPADAFDYLTSQPTEPSEGLQPLAPERICDTRTGNPSGLQGSALRNCEGKAPGPRGVLVVQVTGLGGVPDQATAVVLSLTVVDPTTAGFLSVYPAGQSTPGTSSINFEKGETISNMVIVGLSSNGQIAIYNHSGTTNLVIDVEGYIGPESSSGTGLYDPFDPSRICDTRTDQPANPCTGRAPGPRRTMTFPVDGEGPVPSTGVAAVLAVVTVIDPMSNGYISVYPAGGARPVVSQLDYLAGSTTSTSMLLPVGEAGQVSLYSYAGSPQIAVDVEGYITNGSDPSATGSLLVPASTPVRICDTRPGNPSGLSGSALSNCEGKTLGSGSSLYVQVTGLAGVPQDATAVIVNLTATNTRAASYLTAYPSGATRELTSVLNWTTGQTVAGTTIVPLGSGGRIDLYNYTGSTDVVVDVVGWAVPT